MNNTVERSMFLLSLVLTSSLASAQSTELCQGEYYTEKHYCVRTEKLSELSHFE